jgi:hypothetical protein
MTSLVAVTDEQASLFIPFSKYVDPTHHLLRMIPRIKVFYNQSWGHCNVAAIIFTQKVS